MTDSVRKYKILLGLPLTIAFIIPSVTFLEIWPEVLDRLLMKVPTALLGVSAVLAYVLGGVLNRAAKRSLDAVPNGGVSALGAARRGTVKVVLLAAAYGIMLCCVYALAVSIVNRLVAQGHVPEYVLVAGGLCLLLYVWYAGWKGWKRVVGS